MPEEFPRLRVRGAVRRLVVVFGDQLDPDARPLAEADRSRDAVLMVEAAGESTHVPSHKQRTALFLSAMRHFALELRERGHRVHYVPLDQAGRTLADEIPRAVRDLGPEAVACTEPGEWRIAGMLERIAAETLPDEHFLTSREEFAAWMEGRQQPVMEHFYRAQRRRLGILLEADGKPVGGRWNYDEDNREAFDGAPDVPRRYAARADAITREVLDLVGARFAANPGSLESFRWPVTRDQAKRALLAFVERALPSFGTHQDAMWTGEPFLFHSLLSPALNLELLDPRECVAAAVAAHEAGDAPLNAVEGFVRQIVGWREFIRGVYWHEGPEYGERNGLDEHGALPELYWTGETGMACLRACVGQVLEHGYGHHIQRLMITGNFALIAGVHPRAVSDWYLGMYVDAVDWVTLPNTLGMAMHADGGVVGTKPYAASGRYIQRMSNYCEGCRYDPGKRAGPDACPFTVFYWDFLLRHEERFRKNRRMAMMLRNADRLGRDERKEIRKRAGNLRGDLGIA